MRRVPLTILLVLAPVANQIVSGAVLVGNPLTADSDFSRQSDFSGFGANQQANDFTLAVSGNVDTISWWGIYSPTGTPVADSFTIRILPDNGSGAPVADESLAVQAYSGVVPSRVDSGFSFFAIGGDVYDVFAYTYTPSSPFFLSTGTYYLSVVNDTPGSTDDWFWVGNSATGTRWNRGAEGASWSSQSGELTFQIEGNAVPEPSSCLLLGLVSAGAAVAARRRKQSDSELSV